jgi:hypothetical protein
MKWLKSLINKRDAVIGKHIAHVAIHINEPTQFQAEARQVAETLGPQSIPSLSAFFYTPPPMPSDIASEFTRLGAWLSACQQAIFEILYHFREASLPLLYEVAFGEYDWTQAHAIRILCRFSIEGLKHEQIAADVAAALPTWRDETIYATAPDLAKLAASAAPLQDALATLVHDWATSDPISGLDIIAPLVQHAPLVAKRFEVLLRAIMREKGRDMRDPLLDGHVISIAEDEKHITSIALSGPVYPSVTDYHAIRAALILLDLLPNDTEVLHHLLDWTTTHPDPAVRQELIERLEDLHGN